MTFWPSNSNTTRQLPEIDTDHCPSRSPCRDAAAHRAAPYRTAPVPFQSAASIARNRLTCCGETPLMSPRRCSRSSPLWRKRKIIYEKRDFSHYTCQGRTIAGVSPITLPLQNGRLAGVERLGAAVEHVAMARVAHPSGSHASAPHYAPAALVSRARQQRQRAVRPTYMPWNML